jgi:hypothetical protein
VLLALQGCKEDQRDSVVDTSPEGTFCTSLGRQMADMFAAGEPTDDPAWRQQQVDLFPSCFDDLPGASPSP